MSILEKMLETMNSDLKEAADRENPARQMFAEATAKRERNAAAFATLSSEYKTTIAGMPAIIDVVKSKELAPFRQIGAASFLRMLVRSNIGIPGENREDLNALLGMEAKSKKQED